MEPDKPTIVARDCEAILIPSGEKVTLPAGSQVWITQSLGGSYTVMTDHGYMARVAGRNADALGIEPQRASEAQASGAAEGTGDVEPLVWEQLKSCFDPEIPVNIVDLGLIYHCGVTSLSGGGKRVEVRFTLTARGCGMGQLLRDEMRNKILGIPGVQEAEVELVWDPPWNLNRISSAAKAQLGMV